MSDFIDTLIFLFFCILGLIAVFVFASAIYAPISYYQCKSVGEVTKFNVTWKFWGGCFIQNEGVMIPLDKWNVINATVKEK